MRACAAAPVLSPPPPPSWDSGGVGGAVVRRFLWDDAERWLMWYGGRPAAWGGAAEAPAGAVDGFCGMASSADGVRWERISGPKDGGAVLDPNYGDWWWFDTRYVAFGDVDISTNSLVRSDGGIYFAYVSGGAGEGLEVGEGRTAIGVALSKDGENWTRVEGGYPSGAVLEAGAEGAWDAAGVAGPCMLRRDGGSGRRRYAGRDGYLLYYDAFDAGDGVWKIGRAVSEDGFEFARDKEGGQPALTGGAMAGGVDAGGVRGCCVVQKGEGWCMFLEAVDAEGVRRIAACESDDGLVWGDRRVVLEGQEGEWDCGGVSAPSAVVVDGVVWLFYTGHGEGGVGSGIGVAVSNDVGWTRFERRRGDPEFANVAAVPVEKVL